MRTERFEYHKLKKCLKKIQDLPIEIQLEKLIDNAAWTDYAKERIENLFSSLKNLVESGRAIGRQLHFYGSWGYSHDDEDKKSIYGEYLNKISPNNSDDPEMWWLHPSYLKYLCLSAKKDMLLQFMSLVAFFTMKPLTLMGIRK